MLKNKVCLITGCSRGIGKSILETFAENGAIVYANARQEGSLDETAKELSEKCNTTVIPVYFDLKNIDEAKQAVMKIYKEQKRLDVLVNNAGIMKDAVIGMISSKNIEETFSVNVFSVIELIQLAAKLMIRQKSGSIINMASIVGVNGNKNQLVYSASKGAVIALTKSAAKELAPYNIRVNSISPGVIDTDMVRSIGEEKVAEYVSKIGMGRLGTPRDVAQTCLFLASDMSSYITGENIGINGSELL